MTTDPAISLYTLHTLVEDTRVCHIASIVKRPTRWTARGTCPSSRSRRSRRFEEATARRGSEMRQVLGVDVDWDALARHTAREAAAAQGTAR